MLKYEFVRAIENIALNVLQWLGRGEKELADTAGRDAINGVLKPGRN
jgi:fructose-1,6-bisphosphatase II